MTCANWMRDGVVDCRDSTAAEAREKVVGRKGKAVRGGVAAGDSFVRRAFSVERCRED